MSRDSFVVTAIDRATGQLLLQITGSKAVTLTEEEAARLRRHLAEAIWMAGGRDERASGE